MTEPSPAYQVTWSLEHEADYQRRLLAAYRHAYRAYQAWRDIPFNEPLEPNFSDPMFSVGGYSRRILDALRERMSDRTRMLASQWERALWKKEAKDTP